MLNYSYSRVIVEIKTLLNFVFENIEFNYFDININCPLDYEMDNKIWPNLYLSLRIELDCYFSVTFLTFLVNNLKISKPTILYHSSPYLFVTLFNSQEFFRTSSYYK